MRTNYMIHGKRTSSSESSEEWSISKRQPAVVDRLWHCHVFISIEINSQDPLSSLFERCTDHFLKTYSGINLQRVEYPHISLSKPFTLRFHQIDHFVSRLDFHWPLIINSLNLEITSEYSILFNESKSKGFIAVNVNYDEKNSSSVDLMRIINAVDKAMVDFSQSKYYENPKLHISIASFDATESIISLFDDAILYSVSAKSTKENLESSADSLINDESKQGECYERLLRLVPKKRSSKSEALSLIQGYNSDEDASDQEDDDDDNLIHEVALRCSCVNVSIGHRLFRRNIVRLSKEDQNRLQEVDSKSITT